MELDHNRLETADYSELGVLMPKIDLLNSHDAPRRPRRNESSLDNTGTRAAQTLFFGTATAKIAHIYA
jgi:hypothetical protein